MHKVIPKIFYFIDKLNIDDIKNLNKNIAIIYRNYENKPSQEEIHKFQRFCKKQGIKFLISNYFDIAQKYKLDGFYIPSFNKKIFLKKNFMNKNFILVGSAHNFKEIKIKEKQNVDLIFISPLFKTKNKNQKLGIIKFNYLSSLSKKPIIALGGINTNNVKKLKMTYAYGFSGISHIKKITANKI